MLEFHSTVCPDKIHSLCAEGERHRLRFSNGGMRNIFQQPDCVRAAAVTRTKSGVPVALAVVTWYKDPLWDNTFNVFVHPRYRRRGIGKELYRRLRQRVGHGFSVARWDDTSVEFYDALRIRG